MFCWLLCNFFEVVMKFAIQYLVVANAHDFLLTLLLGYHLQYMLKHFKCISPAGPACTGR